MTVNSSSTVVGYDDYYPFGKIMPTRSYVSSADYRFRFTGKERDVADTGYDYFGARYYDSKIGRWLQVDPYEDLDLGWSPYNYVRNNPLNKTDPDGKFWDTVVDVVCIAVDLYDIGSSLIGGQGVSTGQLTTLGGDVLGAAVPFVTGGGKKVAICQMPKITINCGTIFCLEILRLRPRKY